MNVIEHSQPLFAVLIRQEPCHEIHVLTLAVAIVGQLRASCSDGLVDPRPHLCVRDVVVGLLKVMRKSNGKQSQQQLQEEQDPSSYILGVTEAVGGPSRAKEGRLEPFGKAH